MVRHLTSSCIIYLFHINIRKFNLNISFSIFIFHEIVCSRKHKYPVLTSRHLYPLDPVDQLASQCWSCMKFMEGISEAIFKWQRCLSHFDYYMIMQVCCY